MKKVINKDYGTRISLVIPAYNEEDIIQENLDKVTKYLEGKYSDYEVILVCDGCKDKTAEAAGKLAEKNHKIRVIDRKTNMGKGFSVKEGCLAAKGDYIIFSDADLSTPIEEIDKLLKMLKGDYDVAIGSRALKESDILVRQAWYREAMGKVFNLFVQAIAIKGISDTQCGFKGFTKEAAMNIFQRQTVNGFGFDVELLYIAGRLGYSIKEVPVRWLNREASRVNPLLHPVQMLFDLLKIRIRGINNSYENKR